MLKSGLASSVLLLSMIVMAFAKPEPLAPVDVTNLKMRAATLESMLPTLEKSYQANCVEAEIPKKEIKSCDLAEYLIHEIKQHFTYESPTKEPEEPSELKPPLPVTQEPLLLSPPTPSVTEEQPLPSVTEEPQQPSVTEEQPPPSARGKKRRRQQPPAKPKRRQPKVRAKLPRPLVPTKPPTPSVTEEQPLPSVTEEPQQPSVTEERLLPSVTEERLLPSVTEWQPLPSVTEEPQLRRYFRKPASQRREATLVYTRLPASREVVEDTEQLPPLREDSETGLSREESPTIKHGVHPTIQMQRAGKLPILEPVPHLMKLEPHLFVDEPPTKRPQVKKLTYGTFEHPVLTRVSEKTKAFSPPADDPVRSVSPVSKAPPFRSRSPMLRFPSPGRRAVLSMPTVSPAAPQPIALPGMTSQRSHSQGPNRRGGVEKEPLDKTAPGYASNRLEPETSELDEVDEQHPHWKHGIVKERVKQFQQSSGSL